MRVHFITAALLSSLSLSALADTSASVSIRDISFSLADLRPGDGIAPQITWSQSWGFRATSSDMFQVGYEYVWKQGIMPAWADYWGPETFGGRSPETSMTAISRFGYGQQSVNVNGNGTPGGLTVSESALNGQSGYSQASFGEALTLSPGTQLTLNAIVNAQFAGDAYTGDWRPASLAGNIHSGAYYRINFNLGGQTSAFQANGGNSFFVNDRAAYENHLDNKLVQLTLANNSATSQTYYFNFDATVGATSVVAFVPEPQTYLLMLMGIAVMGGLARKRKA